MEAVVERTTKSEKMRYPIVGALQMHVMVLYETCWHAAMVDVELQKPPVWERDREFHGGDVGEKRGRDNEEEKEREKEFVFGLFLFQPLDCLFAMCCSSK